jgi:hypothetical protein
MAATGFVQRNKGKILYSAATLTQFGVGGATFRGDGNIYSNQKATGIAALTSTTSEVTLDTFSLPANSLDIPGRAIGIYAFGTYANNNASIKTASVYFGSEKFPATTTLTGPIGWAIAVVVQKDAANSQAMNGQTVAGTGATTVNSCLSQSGAEPDTAAITIRVAGQTGVAAANDVVLYGWSVEGFD